MSLPVGAAATEAASPSDASSYMMASESSDAETVVSDIPLDNEDTISEDSLNPTLAGNSKPAFYSLQQPRGSGGGHELTRRLREIAASMPSYETDTSDASAYAPPPQRPPRRKKKVAGNSSSSLSAMEEELRDLEERLEAASNLSPRAKWDTTDGLRESLSTELFGNFTDNEKVCFSYENLARHAALAAAVAAASSSEQEERAVPQQQNQQPQVEEDPISNLAPLLPMPAPVESAVKRMHPMRSSAPHERYSPKPARRTAARKQNSSSPSTPTSEHPSPRSPFFVVARNSNEESVSMPPMGVTSMWIPATTTASYSSLSRKVFSRRQSGGGNGAGGGGAGNSNFASFGNEMILPSKADLGDGVALQSPNRCILDSMRS